MRKPKTIYKLKQQQAEQIKGKKGKERKALKEKHEKQLKAQDWKIKKYRGVKRLNREEKKKALELNRKTREKIKGKTKKEIQEIWEDYDINRKLIRANIQRRKMYYTGPDTRILYSAKRQTVNEQLITVNLDDPEYHVVTWAAENYRDPKLKSFLILAVGENKTTGKTDVISEYVSLDEIRRNPSIIPELYESFANKVNAYSGKFRAKEILIRAIYHKNGNTNTDKAA